MESFALLIEGLQQAQELCEYHGYSAAGFSIQFALDYFGAEEEEVSEYIHWTNENIDPPWEEDHDDG